MELSILKQASEDMKTYHKSEIQKLRNRNKQKMTELNSRMKEEDKGFSRKNKFKWKCSNGHQKKKKTRKVREWKWNNKEVKRDRGK